MTTNELYSLAERQNVGVYAFRLGTRQGMAVQHENGDCDIALDMDMIESSAEEKTVLGHEMGHCMTGSFYNPYALYDERQRNENRANRWFFLNVLPYDDMLAAMRSGITTVWELAEHFHVTEDAIRKAYAYYTERRGLTFCA